ncbi:MAG: DUF362 domain-containing protein [Clostridia bacterium]|nr:DUF362 domain-containing protein [Clostridia bacterium]
MSVQVSVVPLDTYEKAAVRKALEELLRPIGGFDFVTPGIKIAIKANLVAAMKPDTAATTHPLLIRELCDMLVSRGAEVTVGDSPGGPFTPILLNRVYSATGMNCVTEVGASLNRDYSTEKCESFADAQVLRSFEYTKWIDRADIIIDFAKLKSHGMMGMSAGVKNLFGCIPGTLKPEYHYRFPNTRDFASMLVDLNLFFKPYLTITDAVMGMEGNGPTMGKPRKIGALVASKSSFACDLISAKLIGLTPDKVPTLAIAEERGLCPKYDDIELFGSLDGLIVTDFDNIERPNNIEFLSGLVGFKSKFISSLFRACMASRPKLKKNQCVGCRECYKICPAKAITMVNNKPKIDRSKCIRCFCCQEFCPKGALKVHRPIVAKIANKL